jgi:excisionase family DNA binding protein
MFHSSQNEVIEMKNTMPRLRQQAEASEVLTLFEASKRLKVSERTLWQLTRDKAVPHFKVGKQYRFLSSALNEWAVSQSQARKDA